MAMTKFHIGVFWQIFILIWQLQLGKISLSNQPPILNSFTK